MGAQGPGHSPEREAPGEELSGPDRIDVMLPGPAKVPPLGPGSTKAGQHTVPDEVPLELRDGGQDVEEEPPRRRCGVDGLVEHHQVHPEGLQLLGQRD